MRQLLPQEMLKVSGGLTRPTTLVRTPIKIEPNPIKVPIAGPTKG